MKIWQFWAICILVPRLGVAQQSAAQLLAEAERSKDSDPAATIAFANRAIAAPDNAEVIGKAYVLRCWAAGQALPDSTLAFAEQGLRAIRRQIDPAVHAELRLCRGYAHDNAGRLGPSITDIDFALSEANRLRNDKLKTDALALRGEQRYYRGEFNTSLADLNEAHRLAIAANDSSRQRYTLNAIANVYSDVRVAQYDKALEYYRQLLTQHEKRGDKRQMAISYFNLGGVYERQNRLEDALAHYRRALQLDLERGDADEVAYNQRAIGIVLYKLNRPAESLAIVELSVAHYEKQDNPEMIAAGRLSRGIALRMLARYPEALRDLDYARDHFRKTNNDRFLEKVEEQRALALGQVGRYRDAYEALSAQLKLQTALNDRAREEQTTRLRVEFDAEKKERENQALVKQNAAMARIRQLQLIILVLGGVIIAALTALAVRQVRHARRLRITSLTDELTGVPNRRHILLLGDEQFKAARDTGTAFSVLAVDIDHFKTVNDRFGHAAGDAVLRRVSEALQASLRAGDHIGRTGGEEFVAVLPHANADDAADVARRVCERIAATDFTDIATSLGVTVSAGAAVLNAHDASFASILKRADDSLYQAKQRGRNRVELAS